MRLRSLRASLEWRTSATLALRFGSSLRSSLGNDLFHVQDTGRAARFAFIPGSSQRFGVAFAKFPPAAPKADRVPDRLAGRSVFAGFDSLADARRPCHWGIKIWEGDRPRSRQEASSDAMSGSSRNPLA